MYVLKWPPCQISCFPGAVEKTFYFKILTDTNLFFVTVILTVISPVTNILLVDTSAI